MKIKLLLLVLLTLPFVAKGQNHSNVFYNKGGMYVGAKDTAVAPSLNITKLYVKGSMVFAGESAVRQVGTTALTGNFISQVLSTATNKNVFIQNPTVSRSSAVFFTKSAGQTPETPGITNFKMNISGKVPLGSLSDATIGNNDPGVNGNVSTGIGGYYEKQYIMPDNTTDATTFDKAQNFINFPAIVLDTNTYVALHPKVAVTALGRDGATSGSNAGVTYSPSKPLLGFAGVTVGTGALFSVESKYRSDKIDKTETVGVGHPENNILLDVAHLIGNVIHTGTGSSMIDWQLYNPAPKPLGDPGTNLRTLLTSDGAVDPTNTRRVALTGFTPMFKKIGADYMFFNALTAPGRTSISQHEAPVQNPTFMMEAGKGYFVGMDVSTHDAWDIERSTKNNPKLAEHKDKAVGGYLFNRKLLAATKPKFDLDSYRSTQGLPIAAGFETFFNTKKKTDANGNSGNVRQDTEKYVEVALLGGVNFLGNPFTAPLDLSDIVTSTDKTAGQTDFNIAITANPPATPAIRNKYYLPYDASVAYVKKSTISSEYKYAFSVKYYDVSAVGGTSTLTGAIEGFIAPMQMFVVEASTAGTIRLPYSKVMHAKSRMVKNVEQRKDEFLIQILNTEDNTEDRTSVVLREGVSLKSIDAVDSYKGFQDAVDDSKNREVAGLVYTMSEDARPMLTNMVPLNTKQLPLYIVPATDKALKMKLTPYRMETMESTGVWLEDKEKNTFQELTPEFSYDFVLAPVALTEELKNRFVLHFAKPADNLSPESLVLPITCYYNSSVLTILGLNDDDINSSVLVYDLQGRLVAKTTVNNAPQMTYTKALSLGTYVLKIAGKRNHTVKFVNLQN